MEQTPEESLFDQWHRASRQHLHEAGEMYGEHLAFTWRMGANLISTGFIIMIHGLVPALFTTAGSQRIERIYRDIRSRIGKTRAEQIDQDWQI